MHIRGSPFRNEPTLEADRSKIKLYQKVGERGAQSVTLQMSVCISHPVAMLAGSDENWGPTTPRIPQVPHY